MELESIKNEEKFMNFIMFWTNIMIPLVAYAFVMLFLNGERKDAIVLIMVAAAVVTKICERCLGKYAKYIYGCIIPVVGWVFITAVYVLLAIICMIVSDRTRKMFYNIREGEVDL